MTSDTGRIAQDTAATMRATAEALEVAEDALHRSADASPNETTAERLDAIGDDVTAEAKRISRRADELLE